MSALGAPGRGVAGWGGRSAAPALADDDGAAAGCMHRRDWFPRVQQWTREASGTRCWGRAESEAAGGMWVLHGLRGGRRYGARGTKLGTRAAWWLPGACKASRCTMSRGYLHCAAPQARTGIEARRDTVVEGPLKGHGFIDSVLLPLLAVGECMQVWNCHSLAESTFESQPSRLRT